jgi:hypothetical protein
MFRAARGARSLVLLVVPSLAVVTLAVASQGAIGSADSNIDDGPAVPTHYSSTLRPYPQQDVQAATSQSLDGLDADLFASVSFGPPPKGRQETSGLWMSATMKGAHEDGIQAHWEADLAQGAVADRLAGDATNLRDVIVGSDETLVHPDGSTEDIGGGAGDISPGQVFAAQESGQSDEAIEEAIRTVLSKYNLTEHQVRVLHPLGPAVYIITQEPSVETLDKAFPNLWADLTGDPFNYDGLYLQIDGPDGAPLVEEAVAARSGAGVLWFAPGLDDKYLINHGLMGEDAESSPMDPGQ